jgi:protein involved in polysaccharide export with SLBB domain
VLTGLAGCFSSRPADIQAFLKPDQALVTADSYVLKPPDEIEIHCIKVPEIDKQRQQIRPDGKVSFEGIGTIEAAGKTPEQLMGLLREGLSGLYQLSGTSPVDVRVTVYRSTNYYVLGEVTFPGPKVCTGRDMAFSAIAQARPTILAWKERVQVVRPPLQKSDRARVFELDFDRMSAHGDLRKNVLLQEGDVIYVPPTVLAALAMKIEEFIRPIGRAFATVNIMPGMPTP